MMEPGGVAQGSCGAGNGRSECCCPSEHIRRCPFNAHLFQQEARHSRAIFFRKVSPGACTV